MQKIAESNEKPPKRHELTLTVWPDGRGDWTGTTEALDAHAAHFARSVHRQRAQSAESSRIHAAVLRTALEALLASINGMYIEFVDTEEKVKAAEIIARKALASDAGRKEAAVLAASIKLRQAEKAFRAELERLGTDYMDTPAWERGRESEVAQIEWREAVDALEQR